MRVGQSAGGGFVARMGGLLDGALNGDRDVDFRTAGSVAVIPGPADFGTMSPPSSVPALFTIAEHESLVPWPLSRLAYDRHQRPAWWTVVKDTSRGSYLDDPKYTAYGALVLSFSTLVMGGGAPGTDGAPAAPDASAVYVGEDYRLASDPEPMMTERKGQAETSGRRGQPHRLERHRLGAADDLARQVAVQAVDRPAGQRLVFGPQPGQRLLGAEATVGEDGQGAGRELVHPVVVEKQDRDLRQAAAIDRDELALLQQGVDAGHRDAEVIGDVGDHEGLFLGGQDIGARGDLSHAATIPRPGRPPARVGTGARRSAILVGGNGRRTG